MLSSILASCSFDTSNQLGPGSGTPDAAETRIDAAEPPDAATGEKDHLLLTEIKTRSSGLEFIEVHNPTERTIALDDYYLADTLEYALLPGQFQGSPAPAVTMSDFIVKFPAGTTIAPGDAYVVAVRPSLFEFFLGAEPDFRIGGEGSGPTMTRAYEGSIGSQISLTDSGEGIALFFWDGESDLVTDVDLVDVGPDTTNSNALANKTGVSVDGPDSGRDASFYEADMFTMTNIGQELGIGESYQRVLPEEGHERHDVNGNGQFRHDETTEDIATTWAVSSVSLGSAPAGL